MAMTNAISSSSGIITFIRKVMIVSAMLVLVAFLGNGFNLIGWNLIVQIRYYILMSILCIGASLLFFIQFRNHPIAFKYYTAFVTLWPFAILPSSYLQGGILIDDFLQIVPWTFVGAFFMIFYRFRFSEQMILWILILYALITAGIQIAQQIDPLFAIFGGNPDDISDMVMAEKRNGLARFFVGSYHIQMLVMCFFWSRLLHTFRVHWAILSALLVVSIYLYLTKQILISTLLTLGLSFFMAKGRRVKILAFILAAICIVGLGVFWEDLFGEMIQDSKDDSYSHAIRFEFIGYIMEYNQTDPVGVLFGHGMSKPWFAELQRKSYYPSDIGFFGEAIYFGWLWALAYFYVVYRIMVTYRDRIPLYIKLFVICSGLISIFIFPYRNRIELFNWICMIYICSLYIDNRTDLILEETQEQNE